MARSDRRLLNNTYYSKKYEDEKVAYLESPETEEVTSDELLPKDRIVCIVLTIIALIVRLYKIRNPERVVFDEVHFGKFASNYITGSFFVDVHPPLAKMLFGLVGWLSGFDGGFRFDSIGTSYLENNVPYISMRLFPALLGVATVPMAYYTFLITGGTRLGGILAATMVCFDNALTTQSRFVLLDSPLVFATAFVIMAYRMFQRYSSLEFSRVWKSRLLLVGVGLGIVSSIKWVGLFTIAWIGVLTLSKLWSLWSDLQVKPITIAKHFAWRVLALIFVPISIYLFMFAIQFICLSNPGEGDGFLTPEFRYSLRQNEMKDVYADVLYGSKISIRHVNTRGGYLHSHPLDYETGSKQQQITLYPHIDDNNNWKVEWESNGEYYDSPRYIKNGDRIKLFHMETHKRLHSHDIKPPVTEADYQFEVSCYGYEGFEGDANDLFEVEILQDLSKEGPAKSHLRALETKFRLRHVNQNCYLFSHEVKLPKWASEQQEVTCNNNPTLPNSVWVIDENEHPLLGPGSEKVHIKPAGFWQKFKEYNYLMWTINKNLVESHPYMSKPQTWPILKRGINFYDHFNRQIYLLGNPIVWWSTTTAIILYVLQKPIFLVTNQLGFDLSRVAEYRNYEEQVGVYVLGWVLHFLPFFLMKRQLFIHHYLPALYFGIMAFAHTWDIAFHLLRKSKRGKILLYSTLVFILFIIYNFWVYAPITYGLDWNFEACEKSKLNTHWDYNCRLISGEA